MRNPCPLLLALTSLTLLAPLTSPARSKAQDRAGPPTSEVEVMDFVDGDQVHGGRAGPWEEILTSRRRVLRRTLIQTRAHFRREMLESVEDL
jgi:hypothetical protein